MINCVVKRAQILRGRPSFLPLLILLVNKFADIVDHDADLHLLDCEEVEEGGSKSLWHHDVHRAARDVLDVRPKVDLQEIEISLFFFLSFFPLLFDTFKN